MELRISGVGNFFENFSGKGAERWGVGGLLMGIRGCVSDFGPDGKDGVGGRVKEVG